MEIVEEKFLSALLSVDRDAALQCLREVESKKTGKAEALIVSSLEEIGEKWEAGVLSLAQIYMSGVICEETLSEFFPEKMDPDKNLPIIGGVVYLDHHGLGMKIVSSLVKSQGYPYVDLGLGVGIDQILEKIKTHHIEILLVSVLMLPSALEVKDLNEAIHKEKLNVKLVVGGAPFRLDKELWQSVGADACGGNSGDIFPILNQFKEEISCLKK